MLGIVFYVVFAWCPHNARHFVCNFISGLTPFTYFRFIFSLEVNGVSSHILEVYPTPRGWGTESVLVQITCTLNMKNMNSNVTLVSSVHVSVVNWND